MSDPAIEAADKALRGVIDVLGDPGPELGAVMRDLAIAAARAALNPDTGTEVVTVPLPTDTYNSEMEMSMWGWEPAEGLPYYVEFIPNAGSGQVESEHEGERLTPMSGDSAFKLAAALIAAGRATLGNVAGEAGREP